MFFSYKNKFLFAEEVSIRALVEQYGSPLYVYSKEAILNSYAQFSQALAGIPHHIHYAVKANPNLSILSVMDKLGAGFDIVSGGELARVLAIGAAPHKIIFSGVAKSQEEITLALSHHIGCFQVESWPELERIQSLAARLNTIAPIAFRVNPDIAIPSHPYISTGLRENKFGIPLEEALDFYLQAASLPNIAPIGIACHIGSNINILAPFEQVLDKLFQLFCLLTEHGLSIQYLNLGGGLGLDASISAYGQAIQARVQQFKQSYPNLPPWKLLIEPGRALIAQSCILLTKIEYLKTMGEKNFCIVDTGMNHLIRPALYEAYHEIIPIYQPDTQAEQFAQIYDIVGPICETGDFLGKQRLLSVSPGDYLGVLTAGAYGMSMASHYNSRPLPVEILIHEDKHWVIRAKEKGDDLFATEKAAKQLN
jgi:diaminopimelate decarboxylase